MSLGSNYDDVLRQLQAFGLAVDSLVFGKMQRCRMAADREKRGWYSLYELVRDDGTPLIVGSYGAWQGNENNAQKITLNKDVSFSAEQSAALKKRIADDRRRAEEDRKAENARAAREASAMWQRLDTVGHSEYLHRKGVGAHGARFSTATGNLALPMLDVQGSIHGLQIIYAKKKQGRDKDFWPAGLAKKGHFYQIGLPSWVCLVVEGFATGATLAEATGLPVAIAFDAGNLAPVAEALAKRYRSCKFLICADDDYLKKCRACGAWHLAEVSACDCGELMPVRNTGVTSANAAAVAANGSWVKPTFHEARPLDKKGPTDFNDLHALEGLHVVRSQIDAHLSAIGWKPVAPRVAADAGEEGRGLGIYSPDELLDRYALVYGAGSIAFDHQERMLLGLSDLRDACADKSFVRDWQRNPARQVVKLNEVGFDPTEKDKRIKCNLWGGWPTTPRKGECSKLLELLMYLCDGEMNSVPLYNWVEKWVAYPIQHPGAKMKTALVLHGPQGAGKNMFFEAVMAIYGSYGRIVDQSAIEDKFNDWASKMLFMIADEVVARAELFHMKNKLKGLITSDHIRINPKNVTPYDEQNHVNLVFLSNETQPLVLERDDRRYAVIWTPPKLDEDFYNEVKAEIDAGGIEALHYHLLHVDLSGFAPHTLPPMTDAKRDLIEVSIESGERFANEWVAGKLDGVPVGPVITTDLYDLYRRWALHNGYRVPAPSNQFLSRVSKLPGFLRREGMRVWAGTEKKQKTICFPPGINMPPNGIEESRWITDCAAKFAERSREWPKGRFDD